MARYGKRNGENSVFRGLVLEKSTELILDKNDITNEPQSDRAGFHGFRQLRGSGEQEENYQHERIIIS